MLTCHRISFLCFALMRSDASKQLIKKRKADATNDEGEQSSIKKSMINGEDDASERDTEKGAVVTPRTKKQRHSFFTGNNTSKNSAKKNGQDVEKDDTSDDETDTIRTNNGDIKVEKLPGDPFTVVRNNLLSQNTNIARETSTTSKPASKMAALSTKQTSLQFSISPPIELNDPLVPLKPSEYKDRAMAPTKTTNIIPKTVTGGVGAVNALIGNRNVQGSGKKELPREEIKKNAKVVGEDLAHLEGQTPLTTPAIDKEYPQAPLSLFGPDVVSASTVRPEDEVMEGMEERAASKNGLRSESYEAMGFDNLPPASTSPESVESIADDPAKAITMGFDNLPPASTSQVSVKPIADDPAKDITTGFDNLPPASTSQMSVKLIADDPGKDIAMSIAAEALLINEAATSSNRGGSEDDVITVAAGTPVIPTAVMSVKAQNANDSTAESTTATTGDKSAINDAGNKAGPIAPKGTVARRTGTTSPVELNKQKAKSLAAQKGGPTEGNPPNAKNGAIKDGVPKRSSAKPASRASSIVNGGSTQADSKKQESQGKLAKNADGSLARGPKSRVTSVAKEAVSAQQAKPTSASAAKVPVAAQPKPTVAPTSNGAVKKAATVKPSAAVTSITDAPGSHVQSRRQTPAPSNSQSPAPVNQTLVFVITLEAPAVSDNLSQLYYPFPLSTSYQTFSGTVLGQLALKERLAFAAATKGVVSYSGMKAIQFPVAMPAAESVWGVIMKELARLIGDNSGEVVNVTFSS